MSTLSLAFSTVNVQDVVMGSMVFLMQTGFTALEIGATRPHHAKNIATKNLICVCLATLVWWLFGFAFAFGVPLSNEFIGRYNFALASGGSTAFTSNNPLRPNSPWFAWFFQWAFALVANTVAISAVAERCTFLGYFVFTALFTFFIYPVVVAAVFSSGGWLRFIGESQLVPFYDFAGAAVVHLTGGFAGLMGVLILGPRIGRFSENGRANPILGQNSLLYMLGTAILWFGWYGYTAGQVGFLSSATQAGGTPGGLAAAFVGSAIGRVAVTTTIAAASCGLTTMMFSYLLTQTIDVHSLCKGIIGGLVAISATANGVWPWGAFCIGILTGLILTGSMQMLLVTRVDDPLDIFSVHGMCGIWGVLMGAFFPDPTLGGGVGLFFNRGQGGKQLGAQIIGLIFICAWSGILSFLLFFGLDKTLGLRLAPEDELGTADEDEAASKPARNTGSDEEGETAAEEEQV